MLRNNINNNGAVQIKRMVFPAVAEEGALSGSLCRCLIRSPSLSGSVADTLSSAKHSSPCVPITAACGYMKQSTKWIQIH